MTLSPARRLIALPARQRRLLFAALSLLLLHTATLLAQDWFKTETSSGAANIRIAVADFKATLADPQTSALKHTFDATLYSDLATAGIFDVVSKSLIPQSTPGAPSEISLQQWSNAPTSAAMVAFGAAGVQGNKITVNGFLFDAKNTQYPQVLAKQYSEDATEDSARQIAHRFADEIIFRLGGGSPRNRRIQDLLRQDGRRQQGDLGDGLRRSQPACRSPISAPSRSLPASRRTTPASPSPRWAATASRFACTPCSSAAWSTSRAAEERTSHRPGPPTARTSRTPPLAPATPRYGSRTPMAASGGESPASAAQTSPPSSTRATGSQIAWISGRTGLPQLYVMDSDGSAVTRMTDGGYATSPSWSPNGQFLAFAWDRKYGPGAPGGQDIYVMEVATKRWIQLTHDGGRCDFPSWSPDGRHIIYANTANGQPSQMKIWTMLADGTQRRALTGPGADMPNWSWK